MKSLNQLIIITHKNLIIKKRRWFLTLLELLLPCLLVALLVPLKKFQEPLLISRKQGAFRGLPSAGLFSVLASFCPTQDNQQNVNGFLVYNQSRQYELLELLDALANSSFQETLENNLTLVANVFDDILQYEINATACNESSLSDSERIDCILKQVDSMKKINPALLELQRQIESFNSRTELLNRVVVISRSLDSYQHDGKGLASFIRILCYIICGNDHAEEPTPTGDININNDQQNRLGVLEAMLQGNAKILYAPNVTVVNEVISKATDTLDMLKNLNNLATEVVMVLEESAFSSYNSTLEMSSIGMEFIRRYYGEALPLISPISIPPQNRSALEQKWLALAQSSNSSVSLPSVIGFDNETALELFAIQNPKEVIAGIVFEDISPTATTLDPVVKYKIRQIPAFTPTTAGARDVHTYFTGPRDWDDSYYTYGFLWLQDAVERAVISVMTGMSIVEPGAGMEQMAYPCFRYDRFLIDMHAMIPLILALSLLFTVGNLVENIVYEKEHGLTEVMHSMGADTIVVWLSAMLSTLPFVTITNLLNVMLSYYNSTIFHVTSVSVVICLLMVYTASVFAMAFFFSSLYSHARMATSCSVILFLVCTMPGTYLTVREQSTFQMSTDWMIGLSSLSPPSAFEMAIRTLLLAERSGIRVVWTSLFTPLISEFTVGILMVILLLESGVFFALALYIYKVFPGEYGIASSWYFPVASLIDKSNTGSSEDQRIILPDNESRDAQVYQTLMKLHFLPG